MTTNVISIPIEKEGAVISNLDHISFTKVNLSKYADDHTSIVNRHIKTTFEFDEFSATITTFDLDHVYVTNAAKAELSKAHVPPPLLLSKSAANFVESVFFRPTKGRRAGELLVSNQANRFEYSDDGCTSVLVKVKLNKALPKPVRQTFIMLSTEECAVSEKGMSLEKPIVNGDVGNPSTQVNTEKSD